MADKLSWTELRRTLAERAGVTEKEANTFLNAFSGQLVEALKNDKQVKINGLGIFRLQPVAPRKSVDVTTGEEIIIEGYNKIVFAPEAGVKELVEKTTGIQSAEDEVPTDNTPYTSEIDPIKKLGAQAEEIVDILGDLGQSPKEEPVIPEEPEPEPEPEPAPAPVPEPVPAPEPFVYVPPTPEPEPEIIVQEPKKKKTHFFRDVLICVIILLLLLFGAYWFFRGQIGGWIEKLMQPKPDTELTVNEEDAAVSDENAAVIDEGAQAQENEEQTSSPTDLIPEGKISREQILAEFLEASGELEKPAGGQELTYAGWITVEPIHEGSRLAWMAKRYYGSKIYWPYLYDANRDRLTDPNVIEVGTPIRVPKLTAAQRDTTNAQTRAALERLRKQAEAEMK